MRLLSRALALCATAALISLTAVIDSAEATPLETITWSGTLGYGTDSNPPQFGTTSYAYLGNAPYSVSLSFDPTALTGDTCGSSTSINYCNWVFGSSGVTEIVTVNGYTHTYTSAGPGGTLGIGVNPDAINLSIGGVPQFGLNVMDGSSMFASITNANNPEFSFSNVSVIGSFNDSNLGGGASIGGNITTLSASFTPAATAVPEPLTLTVFGAGLAGIGVVRRRRKPAKQL